MKISVKAVMLGLLSVGTFANMAQAQASSCRDYYASYVEEATRPSSSSVLIVESGRPRPHYHGHYADQSRFDSGRDHGRPEHGHPGHDGHAGGGSDDDGLIAIGVIGLGLSITSAVEEAELQNSQDVLAIIDQAQMGDGAKLREFADQVQSKAQSKVISVDQVAAALNVANDNLEFCASGDLDNPEELSSRIATRLAGR